MKHISIQLLYYVHSVDTYEGMFLFTTRGTRIGVKKAFLMDDKITNKKKLRRHFAWMLRRYEALLNTTDYGELLLKMNSPDTLVQAIIKHRFEQS